MAYTSPHDFPWWDDIERSDSGVLLEDAEPEKCSVDGCDEPADDRIYFWMDGTGRKEEPNGMCAACREEHRND